MWAASEAPTDRRPSQTKADAKAAARRWVRTWPWPSCEAPGRNPSASPCTLEIGPSRSSPVGFSARASITTTRVRNGKSFVLKNFSSFGKRQNSSPKHR